MGKAEALAGSLIVGLLLLWGLMAWGTLAAQQESPQPAPDDPHSGQVDHCTNAKNAPAAHKCECHKEPGVDGSGCDVEDKKCKVYCRRNHCHCFHPACDS